LSCLYAICIHIYLYELIYLHYFFITCTFVWPPYFGGINNMASYWTANFFFMFFHNYFQTYMFRMHTLQCIAWCGLISIDKNTLDANVQILWLLFTLLQYPQFWVLWRHLGKAIYFAVLFVSSDFYFLSRCLGLN